MIICSQCGNTVEDDLPYCSECGAHVAVIPANPSRPPGSSPVGAHSKQVAVAPQSASLHEIAAKHPTNPVVWLVIPFGVLFIIVIAIVGSKVFNSNTNSANSNLNYNSNTSPSSATGTPYPTGRLVFCKFNGVNVREAPYLSATIISDIQKGQAVRVIRESSNYDSVFVRSINQNVYDNWSEVHVENSSVRGWIFSGFLR